MLGPSHQPGNGRPVGLGNRKEPPNELAERRAEARRTVLLDACSWDQGGREPGSLSPWSLVPGPLLTHGGLSPQPSRRPRPRTEPPRHSPRPRDLAAGLTIQMFRSPSISVCGLAEEILFSRAWHCEKWFLGLEMKALPLQKAESAEGLRAALGLRWRRGCSWPGDVDTGAPVRAAGRLGRGSPVGPRVSVALAGPCVRREGVSGNAFPPWGPPGETPTWPGQAAQ